MGSEPKQVTLATIAEAVGVHTSTVSRVLRSRDPRTRTARQILEMADRIGYTPNPAAASLRTRNSNLIGVLLPNLTDYVPARVYEGIDAACLRAGYTPVIAKSSDDPDERLGRLRALLALRVDGVVVCDAHLHQDPVIQQLRRRGMPFVLATRRVRGEVSATTNDFIGGGLAAQHLLDLGHQRIGVIAGPQYVSTGMERLQGFNDTLAKRGIEMPGRLVVETGFDVKAALDAARHLLTVDTRLSAIFAANDDAAIGVMGAMREFGLRPGADVAVIGYNDVPFSAYLPVPLSSVSCSLYEVGQTATQLLMRRLRGSTDLRSVRLLPSLVARESTLGASRL